MRRLPKERYVEFTSLGHGSMGFVYSALDTDLQRRVAFKVVRPDAAAGSPDLGPTLPPPLSLLPPPPVHAQAFEELKARFLHEAAITGGLQHPGVVPVYEMGETEAGIPYYTMR